MKTPAIKSQREQKRLRNSNRFRNCAKGYHQVERLPVTSHTHSVNHDISRVVCLRAGL